jgi:hypothetical protein
MGSIFILDLVIVFRQYGFTAEAPFDIAQDKLWAQSQEFFD